MRQDYTDITVVLDRSGSMDTIRHDMEGGFNKFLADQKELPGKCTLTLNQFDTKFENVYTERDIREVTNLKIEPRGGTALLDAVARTINETGNRLRNMKEFDRPSKVVIVIITDGEENSSLEYTAQKVKEMVTEQENKYLWTFVYLGANQDAFSVGGAMGIAKSMGYTNANADKVFTNFSAKMVSVRGMTSDQYQLSATNQVAMYGDADKEELNGKV